MRDDIDVCLVSLERTCSANSFGLVKRLKNAPPCAFVNPLSFVHVQGKSFSKIKMRLATRSENAPFHALSSLRWNEAARLGIYEDATFREVTCQRKIIDAEQVRT